MILALDQATTTGFAIGPKEGPVVTGRFKIETKPDQIAEFCDRFAEALSEIIEIHHPRAIVFEQPIHGGGRMNLRTLRKLYSIAMEIERAGKRVGVPVCEIRNSEAKRTAYGHCPRNKKPADADKRIQAWGIDAKGGDEADAAAIWLEYTRLVHPEAFAEWVKRKAAGA